jgi:hypothetical protein
MNMARNYFEVLGEVSPAGSAAAKSYDLVAALVPPETGVALQKTPESDGKSTMEIVKSLVVPAVGAVVGYTMWKKHPVLGALAGLGVAQTAYGWYKGEDHKELLSGLAVDAVGIVAALKYKRQPALAYVGGVAAATVASSFVSGTAAAKLKAKL